MATTTPQTRPYVPARAVQSDYPVRPLPSPLSPAQLTPSSSSTTTRKPPIVSHSPATNARRHIKRVLSYARPGDYVAGAATFVSGPSLMLLWERVAPSYVGKGGFAPIMRLSGVISAGAGFLFFYQRSVCAFLLISPDLFNFKPS